MLVDIPDNVAEALQKHANGTYGGDLAACIVDLTGQWHRLHAFADKVASGDTPDGAKGLPQERAVAALANLNWISTDLLVGMADTMTMLAGGTIAARTGSADEYLAPYFEWAAADPVNRKIGCRMCAMEGSAGTDPPVGVISVADGFLSHASNTLAGPVTQTFSDRRTPGGGGFDPDAADSVFVEITAAQAVPASVSLVAETWGGARQSLADMRQTAGLLVGTGQPVSGQVKAAIYCLALRRVTTPG